MTRNTPEPDSREVGSPLAPPADDVRAAEEFPDADHQDAELEDLEDDAERERQRVRSALVGLVALVLVILLAGVGFYATVSNVQDQPANPEIGRQMPAPPAP